MHRIIGFPLWLVKIQTMLYASNCSSYPFLVILPRPKVVPMQFLIISQLKT